MFRLGQNDASLGGNRQKLLEGEIFLRRISTKGGRILILKVLIHVNMLELKTSYDDIQYFKNRLQPFNLIGHTKLESKESSL